MHRRQKAICLDDGERFTEYTNLFYSPTASELEAQFRSIAGDAYESVPEDMLQAFKDVGQAAAEGGTGYNKAAQDICGQDSLGESMTLNQIILSCIFSQIETFCPGSSSDDDLDTYLKTIEWQLPKVRSDWDAPPPPPPPARFGPYHDLVAADPEGVEELREKLLEFWPSLTYVASQTYGSNVGRDESVSGLGYGPVYYISRFSMSTAYLATSHFKDQDSLAARMIQARFSGMFRFSCRAFKDYMSNQRHAAAGGKGPPSAFDSPLDYTADWDRNFLLMAAILYSESLFKETEQRWDPSALEFWNLNCVDPNYKRSAVPTSIWKRDREVYGDKDALNEQVALESYGPLRMFGSLRQLQDTLHSGRGADFPEDYVNHHRHVSDGRHFEADDRVRGFRSPIAHFRNVICNPTYKYRIEDAVGDPPLVTTMPQITDTSSRNRKKWDMYVPNELLGKVDVFTRHPRGCGLGIDVDGCDTTRAPSYSDASLWQWAYVTSSHDPEVPPGWHRLIHLKAFPDRGCAANADQICNSRAQFDNQNYDIDGEVGRLFGSAMGLVSNNLGVDMSGLAATTARDAEAQRVAKIAAAKKQAKQAAAEAALKRARDAAVKPFEVAGNAIAKPFVAIGDAFSDFFGRRLQQRRARRASARRLTVSSALTDLVAADGRLDVSGLKSNHNALQQVADALTSGTDTEKLQTAVGQVVEAGLQQRRAKPSYVVAVLNQNQEGTQPTNFHSGLDALFRARCSDLLKATDALKDHPLLHCCVGSFDTVCTPDRPYEAFADYTCNAQPLELDSGGVDEISTFYLDRLKPASPPPSPPPSPKPPPPPDPPTPPPPPAPPVAISADEARDLALKMQRDFCHSVYLLSAEARCSTLATAMAQRFELAFGFSPPSLPPILPADAFPPPPPPSPPSPSLPKAESDHLAYYAPRRVRLSTYFLGGVETDAATASTALGSDMGYANVANATRQAAMDAVAALPVAQWAACSEHLAGAPLPCRTADLPQHCLDGGDRHCSGSNTADNMRAPWIELDMRDLYDVIDAPLRDYYFFGMDLTLPSDPELARLFFASAAVEVGKESASPDTVYTVTVYDEAHNPLATQCKPFEKQVVDHYVEGITHFQFVCLEALATDAEYAAMRAVRYVRLTLRGELRMLWLQGVRVTWRTLRDLPPSPPPDPGLPPLPPSPSYPPDNPNPPAAHVCSTLYPELRFNAGLVQGGIALGYTEPCGLDAAACCALAYEHPQTHLFTLSGAGCCTLYIVPDAAGRSALSAGQAPTLEFALGTTGVRDVDVA